MGLKIVLEGDDWDELLEAAKGVVEKLEGGSTAEAEEDEEEEKKPRRRRGKKAKDEDEEEESEDEEETEDEEEGEDEEESEDEEEEEEDPSEAARSKLEKHIRALVKKADGPDKVRAALKACKAVKLPDVKDKDLPKLAKLLKIKL